ncbi:MAG: AbrB family transcriptional regulator [Clostridia bacterium]|nr:AbrB family transcriptional regulator [Clostridia bacterium]
MNKIGIIKEFDGLGRLVIPKELRERYLTERKVEIIATEEGILLKDPEYVLAKKSEIEAIKTKNM